MSAEQTAILAEFARACRTAARSVSLYPATHPSIRASLSRVTAAAARLIPADDITLTVHPDTFLINGQTPARPDQAISELARLMHDRLVGALRVERGADAHDWHALLLLLARPTEELIGAGGIGKAWVAAGRNHFEIHEIDYAEVLRERAGSGATEWDQIIAFCLQGDAGALDSSALTALLDALGDSARFGELLDRLQTTAAAGDHTVSARAAALLELVKQMLDASGQQSGDEGKEGVLQTVANATSRLTPEMLLAVIEHARAPERPQSEVASAVVERIGDDTIASFVAGSVVKEGGASERLAEALQLLVPEIDRKERVLDLAKQEAEQSPLGQQSGFEDLWSAASNMLATYSDETYVSAAYARELSGAKTQAVDVERVSDDPPERIQEWLSTVDKDEVLRQLDFNLLVDLLEVEDEAAPWRDIARIAVSQIERRTQLGEIEHAQKLAFAIMKETLDGGREALRSAAESAIETLAGGPLAHHIVVHLRKVDDANLEPFSRLCRTIGARIIGPLAEALMVEENSRAIRRLRDLLFGFGAAGRETVERLKQSSNPAVRRTAIDMLRMFGGQDALADLATMLEDKDPQVQRDAITAIAHLGNDEAFAVLQTALMAGTDSSKTIPHQLISLREERAVPLLCYVLNHSAPRGRLIEIHAQIIEALGALGAHPESTQTLQAALYRGEWWAPNRTKALRRAAALALRRIGSPEAQAVLDKARRQGSRGVRHAARVQAGPAAPRREQERT
jgi:HEAT repeat protein/PBS lyase HEAT-like repeat-containing protein